jgi:hypothetical protein
MLKEVMMKIVIFLVLCLHVIELQAQENPKYQQQGFAIQLGTGVLYGGVGGLVEYQQVVLETVRLTPFAGLGISLGGTDTNTYDYYWLNYAIGLTLELGNKHRLVLGPQLIGSRHIYQIPANAPLCKQTLMGPSFMLGYKGTSSFGLIWQFSIGLAYLQNPLIRSEKYASSPHLNIGLGYKF